MGSFYSVPAECTGPTMMESEIAFTFNNKQLIPEDEEKVGDVYVVRYKRSTCNLKNDSLPTSIAETSTHHALIIDLLGSSDGMTVSGFIVHLITDKDGICKAQLYSHNQPQNAASVLDILYLGHLDIPEPPQLKLQLFACAEKVWSDLVKQSGDQVKWNSTLNCQTFAKALAGELLPAVPYPYNVVTPAIIEVCQVLEGLADASSKKFWGS